MLKTLNQSLMAFFSILILTTLFSSQTFAADDSEASGVEEIVVTARKRAESIQDVPVAVSALSAGQLERGSVQTILDVAKLVPNVELHEVTQAGGALGASIRGMAFDDLEKTYEPTVGISIDGVFMASNGGAVLDFFDVEGVEVLRGPQGTLYGRNTIAGVINITRSQPTGKLGAKLEITSAANNREDLKAIINMPLGENGGIKISARELTQDSHLYNTLVNETRDWRDSSTAGLAVRYDFTDNTTATFSYDDYDHNTTPPDVLASGTNDSIFCLYYSWGCASASSDLSAEVGYTTSNALVPITSTIAGENMTLNIVHEGDNFTLKYIMGNMKFDELNIFDSWGAPRHLYHVIRETSYEQTSHEIQYISNYDGPLNFVAGLYFLETDTELLSGPRNNFISGQVAEAEALFGEVTYDFNDDWTLSVGARYTDETKDIANQVYGLGPEAEANKYARNNPTMFNLSFSDDNLSHRVVLQRNYEGGMMYLSHATGFRSGGFNARGTSGNTVGPYQSEEVETLELGVRANPSQNLQLNLTFFQTDYSDKQAFVVTDGTQCGLPNTQTCTFIRNVAEASIDGWEFEGVATPTDSLTIRATVGTMDPKYNKYEMGIYGDISDKAKLIYAPELTTNLTVEHDSQAFGGDLTLSAGWSYKDEVYGTAGWETYNFQTGPQIIVEDYRSLDISATWLKPTDNATFKAVLYGTDVLESGNRVSRAFDAGAFGWLEIVPRRQVGVTLGLEF